MRLFLAIFALFASTAFGAPVTPFSGGTGIANSNASTITINGAFPSIWTLSAPTAITLPASGTLLSTTGPINIAPNAITAGPATFTNITGVGLLDITGTNSTAVLGAEMITNVADRDFSSDSGNWTGTNWTIGGGVDTHVAGANAVTLNNAALSTPPVAGGIYQVSFTIVTTTAGTITANIGGANGVTVGQAVVTNPQVQVIFAIGAGALTFTPNATWAGTLDNVSVQQITEASASQIIRNSDTTIGVEIRSGGSGLSNTFYGSMPGRSNVSGISNSAFGTNALRRNTTGSVNTAIGQAALSQNTTGSSNVAVGASSLAVSTTGTLNTALGANSMQNNTIGIQNTAGGNQTMVNNTAGNGNTAFGTLSLQNSTTASNNTVVGLGAGRGITTGDRNVLIGQATIGASSSQVTTGANNIALGNDVAVASATGSNQLVIGNLIYGTTLSGTGATISTGNIGIGVKAPAQKLEVAGTVRQSGCITPGTLSANASGDIICTVSSRRFKDHIAADTPGLDAIVSLRPVSFQYKPKMKLGAGTHFGFLAEQAASVAPEFASYDARGLPYGLDTSAILAATVKALQQQQIMIEALTQRIRVLESAANDAVYRRAAFK